jgi:hypothetical protein
MHVYVVYHLDAFCANDVQRQPSGATMKNQKEFNRAIHAYDKACGRFARHSISEEKFDNYYARLRTVICDPEIKAALSEEFSKPTADFMCLVNQVGTEKFFKEEVRLLNSALGSSKRIIRIFYSASCDSSRNAANNDDVIDMYDTAHQNFKKRINDARPMRKQEKGLQKNCNMRYAFYAVGGLACICFNGALSPTAFSTASLAAGAVFFKTGLEHLDATFG